MRRGRREKDMKEGRKKEIGWKNLKISLAEYRNKFKT